jgi:DNA-directed RNA polymerase specialized sigma24 family protein
LAREAPFWELAGTISGTLLAGSFQEAVGAEFLARYEAALEQLPEPEREALIAGLESGRSFKEVDFSWQNRAPMPHA